MLNGVARRILRVQLGITVVAALLWGLTSGHRAGLGAAAGGGISAMLSFYVAAKALMPVADESPERMLGALVRAEIMKLLLAAVLVSLTVLALPDQAVPMVTTLAATLVAYWLALLHAVD